MHGGQSKLKLSGNGNSKLKLSGNGYECTKPLAPVAFLSPAVRTGSPPGRFPTVEAAEAAGWRFDDTLGRWAPPAKLLAVLRDVEREAGTFTVGRCMLTGEYNPC